MRSTLFVIPLDLRIPLGPLGSIPLFGLGLLLAIWILLGVVAFVFVVRKHGWKSLPISTLMIWGIVAVLIHEAPRLVPQVPVYGYGTMLFLGFLTAAWVAARRLTHYGYDGEIAWDVGMWGFIAGILGARLFFIAQYSERFFIQGRSTAEVLKSLVNLPDGGLVFYGGLIGGVLGYFVFCYFRRVRPLAFADIAITSLFIGMAFGRIGCLLNGCCYGDVCDLPWAVTFPQNSVPYVSELQRGLLTVSAAHSLPLHPTQLYSSISSAMLVLLTWVYYPYRSQDGEVLAVGWLTYPVLRFTVEFLRGDEIGRFGTSLTISQWVSLVMFFGAVIYCFWLRQRRHSTHPLLQSVQLPPARAAA